MAPHSKVHMSTIKSTVKANSNGIMEMNILGNSEKTKKMAKES